MLMLSGGVIRVGSRMKSIHHLILILTCSLVMLAMAPNALANETDEGMVGAAAIITTTPSNLTAYRGKLASCTLTCKLIRFAECLLLSAAPSGTVCRASATDPNLQSLCLLRC